MGTNVQDIVLIQIDRQTTAVSREAFNIPMFLAAHTAFTERARSYGSLTAVAADFGSSSNVYKAAQGYFGQEQVPPKVIIGRRAVPSVTVTPTVENNAAYTFIVNGVTVTFTSDGTATAAEIVTGLQTAFNAAGVIGATFTALVGTFTISGTDFAYKSVTANLVAVNAASTETVADALAAVEQVNNEWIVLNCESHLDADILALAAAIQGRKKLYGTSSSAAAIKTSGTTDIASQLKAAGYDKTFIMYSASADTQFPECGITAGQIQDIPGSNTWKFKSIAGVTVDVLTDTEAANIKSKNCNTYESIGGVSMFTEGVTSAGEFIDVSLFVLYLEARLRERIFFRLANTKKVAYTRAGFTILENDVRAVLSDAVATGGLADSPAYTVSVPDPLAVDPNLRALRTLEQITFTARLAGAVHKVIVQGTVTV